jgi:hypothetical protein
MSAYKNHYTVPHVVILIRVFVIGLFLHIIMLLLLRDLCLLKNLFLSI